MSRKQCFKQLGYRPRYVGYRRTARSFASK